MKSIKSWINKYVLKTPYVDYGLEYGLLNISALARSLKSEIERDLKKNITEASVVMAINRQMSHLNNKTNTIKKIIGGISDVSTKSNLVEYTYQNSPNIGKKLSELLETVKIDNSYFVNISRGTTETTIIASKNLSNFIESVFSKEEIVSIHTNLLSISLKLPQINTSTSGVYYSILKYFAWNGINIIELISTSNELVLFLDEKDLTSAFEVINQFK